MSFLAALPVVGKLIGGPVEKIIDKLGEDDRREFELAMQNLDSEMQLQLAQIKVNEAEAQHSSMFVSGWRPFIGWSCGIVFVLSAAAGIDAAYNVTPWDMDLNALETVKDMMMPILIGMLGMGSLRTYEKFKGVARKSM